MTQQQIVIDPEFKANIKPLETDEYEQLESLVKLEGCRDALIVWRGENILLDGHNRYQICTANNLPFRVEYLDFPTRDHALLWQIQNQRARRNLNIYWRGIYANREKELLEVINKRNQGARTDLFPKSEKGSVPGNSAKAAAVNNGISVDTLYKVKFVAEKAPEPIKQKAEAGVLPPNRAFDLTKALEKASPEIKAAVIKAEIDNPEMIELLEEKKHTETVQVILATGFMQLGDETEIKPLAELKPVELERGLQKAAKEHKTRALHEKREQVRENAGKEARAKGIYSVIYADPPWQYQNSGVDSAAETRYPTMPTLEICELLKKLEVETTKDAALFLWATNPLLPDALEVIKAWGFEYKTNMVWVKNTHAGGFYVQGYHELLLIATRGSFVPSITFKSVLESKRGRHSEKPTLHATIETMYAKQRYIELFARDVVDRRDWTFWGGELSYVEPAA